MAEVQENALLFTVLFSIFDNVLCVNMTGNCSVNSPPEQMVVREIKGAPVIINCRLYNTGACIKGILPPHLTGSDVAPPRELLVGGKVIPDRSHGLSSQISIHWKAPKSSIQELKGFLFEITQYNISHGNNDSRFFCRIFDMSETALSVGDTDMTFEKKMVGLRGGKNYYYRLDVFSLPKSPSSVPRTKFFSVQSPMSKGHISADRWSTFISYDTLNLTAPASLSIYFTLEKARYNFTRYDVILVSDRDLNNAVEMCSVFTQTAYSCFNQTFDPPDVNQNHVTVSFPGLKEGDYYVQIKPVDKDLCSPCLISQTPYFVVNAPAEVTVTVVNPLPQIPERERYIAVGVGCGLGLLFLATMLVIFRWKTGRKRSSPITEIRNNPFNNDKGKSIFLLCAKDNNFHKETVEKFALYLSNFHRYTVHYLPWKTDVMDHDEKCTWMRLAMDTADFIIVVNSKSAFDAFKRGSNDSISFGISYLRSKTCDDAFFRKLTFVTFEYTEDKFCIKDLNPNAQYQIPDQLKSFLVFLSGNKCFENDMEGTAGLDNTQEGIALREAIRKCKARNRRVSNCDIQDNIEPHKHISQEPCPLAPSEVHSVSTGVIERGIIQITEHYEAIKYLNQFVSPEPSEVTSASTTGIDMRFIEINRKYEDCNTVTECSDNKVNLQSFAQMPGQDNGTRSHNASGKVHISSLREDEYSDKASTMSWLAPTNRTNLSQTTTEVMDELTNINKRCSPQEVEIPEQRGRDVSSNGSTKTFRSNSHYERLGITKRLSADVAGASEDLGSNIDDHGYFKFQPPSDIGSDELTDDINERFDSINVESGAYTHM